MTVREEEKELYLVWLGNRADRKCCQPCDRKCGGVLCLPESIHGPAHFNNLYYIL